MILVGIIIGSGVMIGVGVVVICLVFLNVIVVGNFGCIVGYVSDKDGVVYVLQINVLQGIVEIVVLGVKLYIMLSYVDICGLLLVGDFDFFLLFVVKCYFLVYGVFIQEICGEYVYKCCYQFLVCVLGLVCVLVDDGICCIDVELSLFSQGIYLLLMIWGIQYKYFKDVVLLVFVFEFYDLDEYICDYVSFKLLVYVVG